MLHIHQFVDPLDGFKIQRIRLVDFDVLQHIFQVFCLYTIFFFKSIILYIYILYLPLLKCKVPLSYIHSDKNELLDFIQVLVMCVLRMLPNVSQARTRVI